MDATQRQRQTFAQVDTTRDGRWSRAEVEAAFEHEFADPSMLQVFVDQLMLQADTNGDGFVSLEEFVVFARAQRVETVSDIVEALWSEIGDDDSTPRALTRHQSVKRGLSWQQQFGLCLAGVLAGVGSRTVTAPIERLKLLGQTHSSLLDGGLRSGLGRMIHTEGVRGLWLGNLANCLKLGPQKAFKFLGYENVKQAICKDPTHPTAREDFVTAATVASISQLIVFPLDTIKTRQAVAQRKLSIVACFRELASAGGIRSLFAGVTPALLSCVPFAGISMTTFMQGRNTYKDIAGLGPLEVPPIWVLLSLSALATVNAQLVSYPLYSVKANLQAQRGLGQGHNEGMWRCTRRIFRAKGVTGLYGGLGMNILKAFPATGTSFLVYEESKSALGIA